MHDFASTDKYAVLIEQPLYMDFLAMVGGWDNDAAWMRWRPEEGTRCHLVALDGSRVSDRASMVVSFVLTDSESSQQAAKLI